MAILPGLKVLVCVTEDWFIVSHFLPLLRALREMKADVVVATRVGEKRAEIEAHGARVVDFDWRRGAMRPIQDAATSLRLMALMRAERPDVVHAVALKPIALTLAARTALPDARVALHLTGVGYTGTAQRGFAASVSAAVQWTIARRLASPRAHLFAENAADVEHLQRKAPFPLAHVTLLPGAGVDPDRYDVSDELSLTPPVAGFIGRLIWSKGVDVLIAAQRLLRARGVTLRLRIGGVPDPLNPRSVTQSEIDEWTRDADVEFVGQVHDIAAFWANCSFAVVPSRGGEGLPRALLEAAASGRAAVVSDVPGCQDFIRSHQEGLLAQPGDPAALADALQIMAHDAELRREMGLRARSRVVGGYTEDHVVGGLMEGFTALCERDLRTHVKRA